MSPAPYIRARRLRLGFVWGGGGGLIGQTHANGARLSNAWDVVAGALSSDPNRAQASGRAWQLADDRIYSDFREMARSEAARHDGIDAVAIVTPNHLHAPVAHAFMDAGIDIISDKPLTTTMAEAKALLAKQQQIGVIFGLTHVYACHVMVRQAREMVARGMIGDIRQIHVEYFQDWALGLQDSAVAADGPWRLDPLRGGETFTVGDIGTHAEHLARFVSGLPLTALRAEFHVTGGPKRLEDTAFMMLRFGDNVPGTLLVSQAMAGSACGLRLRVSGTLASLEWCAETPEILQFRPVDAPMQVLTRGHGAGILPPAAQLVRMPRGHPEALTDAWANLYLELATAIAARRGIAAPVGTGDVAFATIEDGLRGMAFCQSAVVSHATGRWVPIEGA